MSSSATPPTSGWGTLRLLNRYQWFVFIVATTAWVADCMDQQLFNLARRAAMTDLVEVKLGPEATLAQIDEEKDRLVKLWASVATSVFLVGWAVGGLFFGVMGDRLGRVKTLSATILLYSVFTGLSAFSTSVYDFCLYRFLTGLGVGGVFAVAVALIAETVPAPARPYSLGLLQAFSAVGNCTAAIIYIILGLNAEFLKANGLVGWKLMFLIGIAPAFLVLFTQSKLKEPEAWLKAKEARAGKKENKYGQLFGEQPWRKHAIFGLILAFSGVVGLWGVGFFAIDLVQYVLKDSFQKEGLSPDEIKKQLMIWAGLSSLLLNVGAFFGMFSFSWITNYLGRKISFAIVFVCAALITLLVFLKLETRTQVIWMYPILGFFQLAIFGGYAIYFPELFPTRLRSTGTSFCYNVGRFIAASGPLLLGYLTGSIFNKDAGYIQPDNFRYAGAVMCSVFLVGLMALPFLPETKGKPLPE